MSSVRQAIKKIRGVPPRKLEVADPLDVKIAEARGVVAMDDLYQKSVAFTRDRNFKKAQEARERALAHKEKIEQDRLKNLKKARKVLERKRNGE